MVMLHSFKGLRETVFYVFLLNRTMALCDFKSILLVLCDSIMSNCSGGEFGIILQKKGKRKCTCLLSLDARQKHPASI